MPDNYTFKLIAEDDLTPDDNERIRNLLVKTFPNGEDTFNDKSYWGSLPEYRLIMEDENSQLIAHLNFERRMIAVNDVEVNVAGVAEVATHTNYQRKGIGTQLMIKLTTILRDQLPVDFGFLQTDEHLFTFYQRVGWYRIDQHLRIFYEGNWIVIDTDPMILPVKKTVGEWETEGIVDLRGTPW